MKKLLKPTVFVTLMAMALSINAHAFTGVPANPKIENAGQAEAQRLTNRLVEIKAMDVSAMTRTQKKELKDEVKSIKRQLKTNDNGGVYISVGAAIIIVLLLILIL